MSSPVITVAPSTSVREAAQTMQRGGFGSVVVVEDSRPVGILTERDLVRLTAEGIESANAVGECMTPDPDTIGVDDDIEQALRSFIDHNYRHLPVVDDGELVGLISIRDIIALARLEPIRHPGDIEGPGQLKAGEKFEAPRGLEGVIVARTSLGDVRGREGFYHYRQYNAIELCLKRSLEDVWHLLFEGHLPDEKEVRAFHEEASEYRRLPDEVRDLLPAVASAGEVFAPLDALRTAVSLIADALDFKPSLDVDEHELRRNALQISAVTPTLVTSLYRLRHGQDVIEPSEDFGYAQNYLYMLTGEEPDPQHVWALERYLISTIDHGFNASTFAARVIASTAADLGASIAGAIGALSGPLHGGAPSRALDMLDAIGSPDRTEQWVRDAVTGGGRIMGFGHRVYKTEDPRSRMLRDVAIELGGPMTDFARQVEQVVVETLAELKPGRELYTNVEFYTGVVLDTVGLPRQMFTPTFASSRTIGWCAHVMEQVADNRLIRPSALYVGEEPPQPVPPRSK